MVEEVADADLAAVLDAVGCERVVLVGYFHSGPTVIRYAVNNPERVTAIVLINTFAHGVQKDDYPWGAPLDSLDQYAPFISKTWGTASGMEVLAPSRANDDAFLAWWGRCQRLGAPPEQVAGVLRASFLRDVRPLLPDLAVPTLILHRGGNRYIRVGAARFLAEHIAGAKYVELPGDDQLFFSGDVDALLDEIEEFLTGGRQAPEGDVVTTTILFTDIVASTQQSAQMGHRKWTALTDAHDAMVRATLARRQGREVKSVGDGFLATFDATTRAVRAAMEIVTAAKAMRLDVRAGVHVGEVEVRQDDVVGLPVSIAKRVCDLAGPGEVFVSEAVNVLVVGSGIALSERGTHVLKGVPDEWRLFAVQA
jgi:class 3 adenylate cyclase